MNREALRRQIVAHEALKLKPYQCTAGALTIGVGRNLDANGISEAEALFLLDNDIARCERELDRALPWWRQMTEARQRAILDMCFNLGISRLLAFKKTLGHMQAGRYAEAADEMLDSAWARQVGKRATVLSSMVRTGK